MVLISLAREEVRCLKHLDKLLSMKSDKCQDVQQVRARKGSIAENAKWKRLLAQSGFEAKARIPSSDSSGKDCNDKSVVCSRDNVNKDDNTNNNNENDDSNITLYKN